MRRFQGAFFGKRVVGGSHVHEMKNHRPPAHVYVCVCGFVFGNRRAGIIGNWLRIRKVVPVPTQVS